MSDMPGGKTLVIGDPIDHSLSPTLHNAAYQRLQIPLIMERRRVSEVELAPLLGEMRSGGAHPEKLVGLAITMPLKIAVTRLVDTMEDAAAKIGAVNTVYLTTNGQLVGANTDWLGIKRPLEAKRSLAGARVGIVGAGGASLAALYTCSTGGASITVFNRSRARAESICNNWGALLQPLDALASAVENLDIIINTTPVGMGASTTKDEPTLFDSLPVSSHHLIFETIYSPLHTPLVRRAEEMGATAIRGDEMFLEQALAQFELHTGSTAPRETMKAALLSALESRGRQ